MADAKTPAERPLSPHLQIYKPTLTMMMSIVHRITGAALYFGTLLLVGFLVATAAGKDAHAMVGAIYGSFLGKLVLFGYTWALIHHMLGGIRHFIWDTGAGLGHPERETIVKATAVGSVALTLALWLIFGFGK
ncbi:MAG TPA: succinate dehydrogenase, cytochrome b556 subunit [Beijerinckiaceae bacterium]|nr:succinate dehydrogenase, cytochrome b556 subunit [Beijerinckiaceae bacterium]